MCQLNTLTHAHVSQTFPGIHSGPVMSGILGKIRRKFCVIGDTVNMASRTETSCPPGCIQVTEAARDLAAPFMSDLNRASNHTSRHSPADDNPGSSPKGQVASDGLSGVVELRERGLVEVKGSPKPIRMFLVSTTKLIDAIIHESHANIAL